MYKNLNIQNIGIAGGQSGVIELAISSGCKGMDLDILKFADHVELRGLPYAKRLIESARIKIGSFRLPFALEDADADESPYKEGVQGLGRMAELAAELGCKACLVKLEPASDALPYHENFELHRKRIVEVADGLAQHGVMLGLEFDAVASRREGKAFEFIHSLDALIQLVKACATENVGIVADLWQIHVGGGRFEELTSLPVEKLVGVILSDIGADVNLEEADETARQLSEEPGEIEIAAVLSQLAEMEYLGPITPKIDRDSFGGVKRDAIVKTTAKRLENLWKEAGLNPQGKLEAVVSS